VSQFHFDPGTYMELMRQEVPLYGVLQDTVAAATVSAEARDVLDLGTGTGETLVRVLERHPAARAVGVDESPGMLQAARSRLAPYEVELVVADLSDPLPDGPFDLVVSALAVHHLDGPGKAGLFRRVAAALRPGGRFVLGDVVLPDDPADAVTPISDDYDKPSSVADQVRWLGEAGFGVAVVWSEQDLAVMVAQRPV
jgi:tRNA (cmo5U34)-methyltransferase